MFKLINTDSYDFNEPSATLMDLHSRGVDSSWLQKRAAVLTKEMADIKPEKGKTYMHLIALGDGERYGCLAPGSKVLNSDGTHIPIEDIEVGDTIPSALGVDRQITTTYKKIVDEVYNITVVGVPENITCSTDHPFHVSKLSNYVCPKDKYIKCKPGTKGLRNICNRPQSTACSGVDTIKVDKIRAYDLNIGDYLVYSISTPPILRNISIEEAELMGLWLAEGRFTHNPGNKEPNSFRFSFGKHERDTLVARAKELCTTLGLKCNIYDATESRSEWVVCTSGDPELAREWHGLFGSGSHNKHIPLWFNSLEDSIKIALLKGYFDGDGHASLQDSRATAKTASYDLAMSIQRLLWSVKVPATVCPVTNGKYYSISYALSKAPEQLQFGFTGLKEIGIKLQVVTDGKTVLLPIRSIEHIDEYNDWVHNLEVDIDHTYSAAGVNHYNCNKNADYFSKQANQDYHNTFVTNGHVYKNHCNKDPKKASGTIKHSAHNEKMSRVELIVSLDNDKWENELQKVASGEDIYFSMACKIPFDTCSICDNKSKTTMEYCDHMKKQAGQILEDGRQVYVDNPNPTFFDISGVFRPADRIAYNLQKVASDKLIITGADLAKEAGLCSMSTPPTSIVGRPYSKYKFMKLAILRKLSELEKEIEMSTDGPDSILNLAPCMEESACGAELSDSDSNTMFNASQSNLSNVLAKLADLKISLPLNLFIELVVGKDNIKDIDLEGVKDNLPGIFTRMNDECAEEAAEDGSYDPESTTIAGLPSEVTNIINDLVPSLSMSSEPVSKRIQTTIIGKSARELLNKKAKIGTIKIANYSAEEEMLAKEYAKYKLSLLTKVASDGVEKDLGLGLGVLQNYVY